MLDSPISLGKFDALYTNTIKLMFLIRYRATIALNLWVKKPTFDRSVVNLDGYIRAKSDLALTERVNRRIYGRT